VVLEGQQYTLVKEEYLGMKYHNVDLTLCQDGMTDKELTRLAAEVAEAAKIIQVGGALPKLVRH
jgi:hypothetical protein